MALSSRQLDSLQRNTVRFLLGAGAIGICLTAYTIISFTRFQMGNKSSPKSDEKVDDEILK